MKSIAIITGATSGIGKELLLSMPKDKVFDEVWVVARDKERLEKLKDETSLNIVPLSLDLCDNQSIATLIEKIEAENVNIKLLINSSGFGKFGKTEDISLEDTLSMIDLNCKALTAITHASIKHMEEACEIIEIASIAGFQAIPYINVYSATKAYVLSFTRALRSELKAQKIKVLAVCPFWTKTAFIDRAKSGNDEIIKKYFAVYDAKKVAKRAWRDLKKNKKVSSYGAVNKIVRFFVSILPSSICEWVWKKSQKLK